MFVYGVANESNQVEKIKLSLLQCVIPEWIYVVNKNKESITENIR